MRRFIRYLLASLFLIALGLGVTATICLQKVYGYKADVAPVNINRPLRDHCAPRPTTDNFQDFWAEFREAVRSEDRDRLFPLLDNCNFVWMVYPALDLKDGGCYPLTLGFHCLPVSLGARQVFDNRSDFDKNYDRIFAKEIREKILTITPRQSGEKSYSVSWLEEEASTYSLDFELINGVGYKFTGLTGEPLPVMMPRRHGKRAH